MGNRKYTPTIVSDIIGNLFESRHKSTTGIKLTQNNLPVVLLLKGIVVNGAKKGDKPPY